MTDREKLIELLRETEINKINGHIVEACVSLTPKVFEAFADHLLANGVIVLPCKVGDTVYEVINNTDACLDCQYHFGGFDEEWCEKNGYREYPTIAQKPLCEKQFMEVVEIVPDIEWIFVARKSFGNTVFLNREEAEATLLPEPPKEEDNGK